MHFFKALLRFRRLYSQPRWVLYSNELSSEKR